MHNFYLTKFFQQLIFGGSTNRKILLVTFVYLLQLAAVVAVDAYLIHNIPAVDVEDEYFACLTREDGPDFSAYIDGEILDTYGSIGGYHVLYRAENGERKLVPLSCNEIFFRYRVKNSSEITIPEEDPFELDTGPGKTRLQLRIEGDQIMRLSDQGGFYISRNNLLYIYMLIALLILAVEGFILMKLKGED